MSPIAVPKQPQDLLSWLSLCPDSRVKMRPTIGVKIKLSRKAHPKPMLYSRPKNPTSIDSRQPVAIPNIIRSSDMLLLFNSVFHCYGKYVFLSDRALYEGCLG